MKLTEVDTQKPEWIVVRSRMTGVCVAMHVTEANAYCDGSTNYTALSPAMSLPDAERLAALADDTDQVLEEWMDECTRDNKKP